MVVAPNKHAGGFHAGATIGEPECPPSAQPVMHKGPQETRTLGTRCRYRQQSAKQEGRWCAAGTALSGHLDADIVVLPDLGEAVEDEAHGARDHAVCLPATRHRARGRARAHAAGRHPELEHAHQDAGMHALPGLREGSARVTASQPSPVCLARAGLAVRKDLQHPAHSLSALIRKHTRGH